MDAADIEVERAISEAADVGDDDFPYDSDRRGGRAAGIPNYKNDKLIPIMNRILPRGDEEWKQVAILYKEASGESILRTVDSLQGNWKKLCNGFKKPTGSSGNNTDRIHMCNAIQRKIYTKSGASTLGASSAENSFDDGPGSETDDIINVDDIGNDLADFFDGTSGNVPSAPVPPSGAAASTNRVSAASTPRTDGRTTATTTGSARTNGRRVYGSWNLNVAPGGVVGTPKTKNATNQQRGTVAKTIEKLVTSLDSEVNGGDSRRDTVAMSLMQMQMQMQQQSQNQLMQQQMFQQQFQAHMEETRKSNESTNKLLKILVKKNAKKCKKRKKRQAGAEGKENDSNRGNSSSRTDQSSICPHTSKSGFSNPFTYSTV